MLVYFYDLKMRKGRKKETKQSYNRLKRLFYYYFNKIKLEGFVFKTKSVFFVEEKYEKVIDGFFLSFKDNLEVYKIKTEDIEQFI